MNDYMPFEDSNILFSKKSLSKIQRMKGQINVISTVCPDYPNNGRKYIFRGKLGNGIGLVARKHLELAPKFLDNLKNKNVGIKYLILTADLPELVDCQKEFYLAVADSEKNYLEQCKISAENIFSAMVFPGKSETFSSFYGSRNIDYLSLQEEVSRNILREARENQDFRIDFQYFIRKRSNLSEKFRGRGLSDAELGIAAAHGMSLYVTHGTLLRKIFEHENLIVLNHDTINLKNFFRCEFVSNYKHLKNLEKFPIGIIPGEFY